MLYISNQYRTLSLSSSLMSLGIKGWKQDWLLYSLFLIQLTKFVLLGPKMLGSVGPELLVPNSRMVPLVPLVPLPLLPLAVIPCS